MAIIVEKNIPLEPLNRKRNSGLSQLIDRLEVGDSFECNYRQCHCVRELARNRSIKLVSRKIENDKYRVWRVA